MRNDLAEHLREQLRGREREKLYRRRLTLEGPQNTHVCVEGREYLSFCSNDYLGLANHPQLIAAVCEGARKYGVGAGASHLISGHFSAHHALEEALARFTGFPRALLFSTGYMANAGVITALAGRGDAIFADKLNHASLNDAALLSRAKFIRYPHLDLAVLERQLAASQAKHKLVLTDAVFSMDGDIAPVANLLALCEKYNAWLLLDDAHGFGVLGPQGQGSVGTLQYPFAAHYLYGNSRQGGRRIRRFRRRRSGDYRNPGSVCAKLHLYHCGSPVIVPRLAHKPEADRAGRVAAREPGATYRSA